MPIQPDNSHRSESREAVMRGIGIVQFNPPAAAKDYLSESEWCRLAWHMHNENGPNDFSMYFIGDNLVPRVAASRRRAISDAIQSTWRSMTEEVEKPFAAVLYPTSQAQTSTWACIDVDHHTASAGAMQHAEWAIKKISTALIGPGVPKSQELAWVIEASGRGYHVFLLSSDHRPVKWWRQMMHNILDTAGLKEQDGIELYPLASGKRMGVRLPGSANPKTWTPTAGAYAVSRFIAVAGLKELISGLPVNFNKRGFSLLLKSEEQGSVKLGTRGDDRPDHWSVSKDAPRLLDRYAINAPSTRHNQLRRLVGDGFQHFGRNVLWEIAAEQHARADPRCGSDLGEHRAEFENLYAGILRNFIAGLNSSEREVYHRLNKQNHRAAFVIVRNFARLAARTGKYGADGSFPFSGQELACRLQIGKRTAYNVRNAFIDFEILQKVSMHIPRVKADYFVWNLPMGDS